MCRIEWALGAAVTPIDLDPMRHHAPPRQSARKLPDAPVGSAGEKRPLVRRTARLTPTSRPTQRIPVADFDAFVLSHFRFSVTLGAMEVHFTPEQQAQLAQIATKAGTVPERLVTSVVTRYLDEEARFLAAVEKGIAAAERGEFIEEEEMDARLEAMFKP